ncbi:MAG TPA: 1-(5-phosphoribosyl)-5-[(5-phosphoribosylamino)methylideneamino]imidazole-4-carboxamide isomerase [Candidatus Dormibacteraeota bacterium]|nr:1-(5-phosphoribosyl)-5-[(5-phosphoribosylamino)methylideneamino]imidazole-4-carboxamide isomerase [Candidatus Dormibacteraeota bacterium]
MALAVIPAIDILGGKCVRLTKGDYATATVYADDPVTVSEEFAKSGARRLHVVDLDAARGTGDNSTGIQQILQGSGMEVQVAGGVRSEEAVERVLARGAHWAVMGTAAVRDPSMFERCARLHPGRVLAALDMRNGQAAVSGWTQTSTAAVAELLGRWERLPLGGVILTCIDRDGTMSGPDIATLTRIRRMTGLQLHYSGGISSVADLNGVEAAGADAAILGKALYEGKIKLEEAFAR